MIKKTISAIFLNLIFGGAGYLYLRSNARLPLGIFLTVITVFEFIRNFTEGFNVGTQGNPFAVLPMLSLFGSIFGTILLTAMTADVYLVVKQQDNKARQVRVRKTKTA